MQTRRQMLKSSMAVAGLMGGLGLLPQAAQAAWNKDAFAAKTMADLTKALGVSAPTESADVQLKGPDIAENGAVVPVGVSSTASGVKQLLILVEKNPSMLAASFDVTDAIDPSFETRVKMGQSSNVIAVAVMNNGKVIYSQKEIKVTLGGCGG